MNPLLQEAHDLFKVAANLLNTSRDHNVIDKLTAAIGYAELTQANPRHEDSLRRTLDTLRLAIEAYQRARDKTQMDGYSA